MWIYATAAVVIVVGLIIAAYAVESTTHHSTTSSAHILVPAGTLFGLPGEQFNSVVVELSNPATLNGTVDNQYGFVLYQMSPAQVQKLALTNNVSAAGSEWTSGPIQNGRTYYIELPFPAGDWDLVFYNPSTNALTDSYVGFVTDLVEQPA